MNSYLSELTEQALALPLDERAALADRLISSFDNDPEEIEKAWSAEALRRLAQIESGEVELVDHQQIMAEIEEVLR